jgi:hypothetical protein
VLGGVTAFFGHLGSAASAGFPLGLLHLSIACLQLLWVFLFGLTVRRIDKSWAFAIAIPLMVGLNGYVSPHLLAFFLGTSDPRTQAIIGLIPFLVIATLINALLASILYVAVLRTSKRERHPEYKAP